jgi:RNA polymerase sigma-70 factor (ECF subfamily)
VKTSSRHREEYADEAVIRLLFERYGAALLAYTTGLTGSRSVAEEIVQETMLRAWRHADKLWLDAGVRGWLMTVARNLSIDRVRARAARPAEVTGLDYLGPVLADHANPVADALDMREALRALSAKHRQVLIELYYKDRTTSEAAEHLGVPVGTVKSRAYHALRCLREYMDRRTAAQAATTGPSRPAGATNAAGATRAAPVTVAARVTGAAASAARSAVGTGTTTRLGRPITALP